MTTAQSDGLVRELFAGPIDIVGDVHGEIEALRALLQLLGYDDRGNHVNGRRLVFIGDLCDRGPNSPGVVRIVRQLVEDGRAQLVLGNHEINLLRGEPKHGNHWFFGDPAGKHEAEFGATAFAGADEARCILAFLDRMPLALERDDLRVVHAAWTDDQIAACRAKSLSASEAFDLHEEAASGSPVAQRLKSDRDRELARHAAALTNPTQVPPPLPAVAAYDEHQQMSNPLRVVTSGVERVTPTPFYAAGKWRFVERVPWWRGYAGAAPVVFGHYWRWWDAANQPRYSKGEANLFAGDPPDGWQRNAAGDEVGICIDYSVGVRFRERKAGTRANFAGRLAALRWPERQLVFDSGPGLGRPDLRQ
jgi:hypothetical protein